MPRLFASFARALPPFALPALTIACCLSALPAAAERTVAQTAALSAELFLVGLEDEDPLLLLAAAKLRKSLNLRPVERVPEKDMPPPGDIEGEVQPLSWEEILDTAVEMAPEDEIVIAIADDIRSVAQKGVASGQVYSITTIRHGGTDTYPAMRYRGSEYADVYVEGTGGADLNLYVHDALGRLVCSDTDISAIAHCGWTPSAEAQFVISVKNRGRGSSGYSLITN